jgi:subtilisin family serine protease
MKKYLNICISTLLSLSVMTACGRFENNPLITDSNLTEVTNPNGEFNALGQSNKRFAFSFKANLNEAQIKNLEKKYNTKFTRIIPQIGIAIAEKTEDTDLEAASSKMKSESLLENAEPINQATLEKTVAVKVNDPDSKNQYHLDLLGVREAWSITMGNPKVTLAIIDTGIDLNHPDLRDKIVTGKNIVDPGLKPMDDNGHGTHVAGIAGAETGNGIGVAGIAPDCAIMPVKVMKNGLGTDIDIAEGIVWAADHGADVMNISIGLYARSTAMERAVKYALNKNVVIVSSAGNDGKSSQIHIPSMIKGVIEVSATTRVDHLASFSNYAQQISVSAPGDNILSTMPTYNVKLTAEAGKNYGILSGTSMSSPMVAGLAALIKSEDRNQTPKQVRARLESSAVDLGKRGYDEYFGNGRIDAFAALQ